MSRSRILTATLALGALAGTAGAAVAVVSHSDESESEAARPRFCYEVIYVDGQRYYLAIPC